jgi:hypothetical protein
LIAVKGIMDYGDPKENEALIELLRANRTLSCKAGQTMQEVNAQVVKIEKAVTFKYDGKNVVLGIRDQAGSASGDLAAPPEPSETSME